MKKLKVILIGAGLRGITYTDIMSEHPDKFDVVAVAEPVESRRNYIKEKHNLPDDRCFDDWKPLLKLGKIADIAIVATMDQDHYECTMEAINLKYDILLEKPVCPSPEECKLISDNAVKNGVRIIVCHVLRYSDVFVQIKDIIDSGKIGDIVSINMEECVGNVHQSHSFVRGNWGNSERSSFMLLQKSCHDMDIIQWLIGKKCKKVQSFGSLKYFKEENAPEDAPLYCIDGCPHSDECPYDAVKLYLDDKENQWFRTSCTHHPNPDDALVEKSLRTTQYGKCVFKCDNDVVDHQTVNLIYEDDVTVTFTMCAFNSGLGRKVHIMGTKGELNSLLDGKSPIYVYDFLTKKTEEISTVGKDGIDGGHGGGDIGIVMNLYDYFALGIQSKSVSDIVVSCDNHITAFAAEESRLKSCVIDLEEYKKSL